MRRPSSVLQHVLVGKRTFNKVEYAARRTPERVSQLEAGDARKQRPGICEVSQFFK
jgi:hypothetical protein